MIRLYTSTTPNGRKVSIALEELDLPYEVEKVDLQAGDQFKPEFLALSPNNKIPAIDDDGLVVWESGAILIHLAEKYGKLLPVDPRARIQAIQYAFFQAGGIGPNVGRLGDELTVFGLGPRTMRTETAAIATATLMQWLGGDLR